MVGDWAPSVAGGLDWGPLVHGRGRDGQTGGRHFGGPQIKMDGLWLDLRERVHPVCEGADDGQDPEDAHLRVLRLLHPSDDALRLLNALFGDLCADHHHHLVVLLQLLHDLVQMVRQLLHERLIEHGGQLRRVRHHADRHAAVHDDALEAGVPVAEHAAHLLVDQVQLRHLLLGHGLQHRVEAGQHPEGRQDEGGGGGRGQEHELVLASDGLVHEDPARLDGLLDGVAGREELGHPVRPLRRQVVNQQMVRKVLVVHDEAGGIRADGALPVRAQELVHALHVLLHVRLGPEVDVLHHPVPPLDREDVVGLREQVHARRLLQSGQQVPRLLHLRDHALLQGLP
mmetsp:Transcript_2905/g.5462  ORF Transcript_2905/g.5462 Transcript_2905/m.5462 type:complete len:342 (+) Transcript_2905:769-1794(+)